MPGEWLLVGKDSAADENRKLKHAREVFIDVATEYSVGRQSGAEEHCLKMWK